MAGSWIHIPALVCLPSLWYWCLMNHFWPPAPGGPTFHLHHLLSLLLFVLKALVGELSRWGFSYFKSCFCDSSRSPGVPLTKRLKDVETTRLVSPYHHLRWKTPGGGWGAQPGWERRVGSHRGVVTDGWMTALFSLASSFPSAAPGPETGRTVFFTTANTQNHRI